MQTKRLGTSDLELTPIGIGAWAMGGAGWAFTWGAQDDGESIGAIHAALDAGLNWIDTAAVYGLGHSEEVVARALKGRSHKPLVFTKCARVWNDKREIAKSLKADSIRRELEGSLRRLQLDTIDLYQMHWPEPDADLEEGWGAMAQLRKERYQTRITAIRLEARRPPTSRCNNCWPTSSARIVAHAMPRTA